MKKILSLIIVCATLFVACSPADEDKLPAVLTLTSENHIDFKAAGGSGTITYTLENVDEGSYPTAESAADWVTNIVVGEAITFDVAKNEAEQTRVATILVSYEEQNFSVSVSQAAAVIADVEFEALALNGEYFGIDQESGAHNYFAILSTKGTTGLVDLYIDTYYRFDIFSDVAPVEGEPLTLPCGTYTLDSYSMGEPGTFDGGYSLRVQPLEDGTYLENFFMGGELIVKEDSIEGTFLLDNGEVHHLVYSGSRELSYLKVEYNGPFSYLEEDYTFEHSGGTMRLFYYGDYYGLGAGNWSITVMESVNPINGDYFTFDVVCNSLGNTVEAVYGSYVGVASVAEAKPYTFLAGAMDGSQFMNSWYKLVEDDYIVQASGGPMMSGNISIEAKAQSGGGTEYVLTVDCVDDLGYKVQGTFSCLVCEVYDRTSSSAAKPLSKSLVLR